VQVGRSPKVFAVSPDVARDVRVVRKTK
jgi:hypothetical protein